MLRLALGILLICTARTQDLDGILQKADQLLEQAKTAYEEAKAQRSVPAFVDAGFKLEEARIKYLVLQEIGPPDKQKIASERLRAVNQLMKLVNDGKVAINAPPPTDPAPTPAPAANPGAPNPPTPAPAGAPPPPPDVMKRRAVPDPKGLKDAEKALRDLFKTEYAKKTPADRIAFARTLLEQAPRTQDDPNAAWVMCRDAQDIAVQLGDVRLALSAVDITAQLFDVDSAALRLGVLTTVAKSAKQPTEFGLIAESLLGLLDELIASDQYDAADKAATQASQAAKKAGDVSMVLRATSRAKDVTEAKNRFTSMKKVLETLAKDPDDPAGNLEMGQFLCFVKGSWDLGLRFLAKGSDATLKALAEKDLAVPQQPAEQIALADGWWDLAEKEKIAIRKQNIQVRVKILYEVAYSGASGVSRLKIEKRLDELEKGLGGAVNLLRLVDLSKDVVAGQWRFEGGTLWCPAVEWARIQIPYLPPEEYDLSLVVQRRSGMGAILIGMVAKGSQFSATFDESGKAKSYLQDLDGIANPKNETVNTSRLWFPDQRPHTVLCQVRKKGVTVLVDGQQAIVFEGEFRRLSLGGGWQMPDTRTLLLATFGGDTSFSQIKLMPVTGTGKRSR